MIQYKNILKDDNPIVRQKSVPVKLPLTKKDRKILEDMLKYVEDSVDENKAEKFELRPAVGLAASQLGILKQMFVMAVGFQLDDDSIEFVKYAFVNPRIISYSVQKAYLSDGEGCLSVEEEHQGYVARSARITIRGYDMLQDTQVDVRLKGYLAIVAQHEIDHFSGILFYDHINKENPFAKIEDALVIE